jgi:uncharacterized protein
MDNKTIFKDVVTAETELRELLGEPRELVRRKAIGRLDGHCRAFIAKSPFLVLATADAAGNCDASPRGDGPGFVHVLDDFHLVIPERPGNRRMDSMRNILSNPRVGVIFLIPGLEETLRVNGRACVIRDADILSRMAVNGKVPAVGIGVRVEECFVHCAKAFKRSGLWQPEAWLDREQLPAMAQVLADHINMNAPGITTGKQVEEALQESYTKRLY